MIIMNVIYKINKYKFFLFIIYDINALKNLFYTTFCFLTQKKKKIIFKHYINIEKCVFN